MEMTKAEKMYALVDHWKESGKTQKSVLPGTRLPGDPDRYRKGGANGQKWEMEKVLHRDRKS